MPIWRLAVPGKQKTVGKDFSPAHRFPKKNLAEIDLGGGFAGLIL
jgi:hypothetical protein